VSLPVELLIHLHNAGLVMKRHALYENAWFFRAEAEGPSGGDVGPFASADEALVEGVVWLIGTARDARTERDAYRLEASRLRARLGIP
jgi:hypothetical protein